MKKELLLKRFIFYNLLLLFFTALFLCLFFLSKDLDLGLLECAVFKRLRIYCPGCGGTRALIFLLRLDFLSSFLSYPPLIISAFVIAVCDFLSILSLLKNDMKYISYFKSDYFLIIPAVIILNFFIRNFLLFCGIDYMPTL